MSVEVDLIVARLQNRSNVLRVVELSQINVRSALLDGVTNQLGRPSLTLGAHDCSLLLLPRLVDDEGGALGFLLGDLLGFYSGGKFGGKGEVLDMVNIVGQKAFRFGLQ